MSISKSPVILTVLQDNCDDSDDTNDGVVMVRLDIFSNDLIG